jgi:urease accessory protein
MTGAALHLFFEREKNGSTLLRVKQQQPPWRVVRGFPTPSGETLAHIHNVSGGILDTDSLVCRIELGACAQAQVTTTGATRIYRSRSACHTATQQCEVQLGEGSYLEYLPDQLIPYAGSRFRQIVSIRLSRRASIIWWERVAPGREASGELFQYQSLASSLTVVADSELVALERWSLAPLVRPLDSLARLGPFLHFASCYVCCAGEPAAYWRDFESQLQRSARQESNAEILWGVSALQSHGLVIRGVSTSGRLFRDGWVKVWKAAKWLLCGRAAAPPRKIN